MARLRRSALTGSLTAAIDDNDGELASDEFTDLPVVAYPDYLVLTLDPAQTAGRPETVYVYAHADGATTVLVTRGREQDYGSAAGRSHASGTTWSHGPTAGEFTGEVNSTIHDDSADPILLAAQVVSVQVDADIELVEDGDFAEVSLVLVQGTTGGSWVTHTGVSISWAEGSPPTLSNTAGNYDVIRLIRVQPGVSTFIGRLVVADATLAPA